MPARTQTQIHYYLFHQLIKKKKDFHGLPWVLISVRPKICQSSNSFTAASFQENYIGLTYFSQSQFDSQLNIPLVVVSIALDNNVRL